MCFRCQKGQEGVPEDGNVSWPRLTLVVSIQSTWVGVRMAVKVTGFVVGLNEVVNATEEVPYAMYAPVIEIGNVSESL